MNISDFTPEKLRKSTTLQLRALCREFGIRILSTDAKTQLIDKIIQFCEQNPDLFSEEPIEEELIDIEQSEEVAEENNAIEPNIWMDPIQSEELNINVCEEDCWNAPNNEPNNAPTNDAVSEPIEETEPKVQPKNDSKKESKEPVQQAEDSADDLFVRSGILEINPDGFGFLRAQNYRNSAQDTYVSTAKIRSYQLRQGDLVECYCKQVNTAKPPALVEVITINEIPFEEMPKRPLFENCIPIYPDTKLRLEVEGKRNDLAMRAIDIIAPIGKGQRAMVVSPPKAGKTTLLKMIANAIAANNSEVKIMVLLIDERPEEVTDMQRSIKGEVIYSTFDEECDNHIKVAELVLSRAKRLVELGQDVVVLLDSLTRLARANNVVAPSSGKTLSGGVDPVSLYFPKKFFGAARNIENGASLTIIATALVDTGSRMDDIVYEEFKGTGNMEIHLDRKLSEKRIFPAIDLLKSGTRKEELLLSQKELEGEYIIRRLLSNGDSQEATESIITMMTKTQTNEDLIKYLNEYLLKVKKDGWRI